MNNPALVEAIKQLGELSVANTVRREYCGITENRMKFLEDLINKLMSK